MRWQTRTLIGILAATAIAGPAVADDYGRDGPHRDHWHGHGHDYDHWRDGHWWRGVHDGRDGWWWLSMGRWYYYPAPVYPYPVPYAPPVVVAPAPLPPPVPVEPGGGKAAVGTVLGAVGGGLAGAQFGHGSGKLAATALGTLLGAFIGHEAGASLDRADIVAAQQSERQAYGAPIGQRITWSNPGTGHSGSITPLRDGMDQSGNFCRQFRQSVSIDGRVEEADGTACRGPDGTWRIIGQ